MAQKIIQIQMRHLYFNLKDLFSNRKGFVILTSLLRFKNKSREFREFPWQTYTFEMFSDQHFGVGGCWSAECLRKGVLKFELGTDVWPEVLTTTLSKPEKMQICNPCVNHLFLEGPLLTPIYYLPVNWDTLSAQTLYDSLYLNQRKNSS